MKTTHIHTYILINHTHIYIYIFILTTTTTAGPIMTMVFALKEMKEAGRLKDLNAVLLLEVSID